MNTALFKTLEIINTIILRNKSPTKVELDDLAIGCLRNCFDMSAVMTELQLSTSTLVGTDQVHRICLIVETRRKGFL